MKRRKLNITYTVGLTLLLTQACTPNDFETFENPIKDEEIKIVELYSDHKDLLTDGISEMEFRYTAFGVKEVVKLIKTVQGVETSYKEESVLDTFPIPADRISPGFIKVYQSDGTLLENNMFSSKAIAGTKYNFYAKAGNVTSAPLTITLREDDKSKQWQEIEIPVMFHVMTPPSTIRPTYSVSSEGLQKQLDYLNKIYNKQASKDPNGGNAKIKFVLAKYDPKGGLLQELGLRRVNVAENLNLAGYKTQIQKDLWNPAQYLNVYLCKFADGWSSDGSQSYAAPMPNMLLKGETPIPGINAREIEKWDIKEVKDVTDVCIIWNVADFFRPASAIDKNSLLEFSTIMGYHLGLINVEPRLVYNPTLGRSEYVLYGGDSDYCPDTDVYIGTDNYSLFKRDYFNQRMFTAFNIMMNMSRKNSITLDQASRIREVFDKCPSRWYYKSKWATTGK